MKTDLLNKFPKAHFSPTADPQITQWRCSCLFYSLVCFCIETFLVGDAWTQKQDSTAEREGIKWDLLDSRQRSATWQAVSRGKQIQKVSREAGRKEQKQSDRGSVLVGRYIYLMADYGEWEAGVLAGKAQVTGDRRGMTWQHRFKKLNSDTGCFWLQRSQAQFSLLFLLSVLLSCGVCMFWYFNELMNQPLWTIKVVLCSNL